MITFVDPAIANKVFLTLRRDTQQAGRKRATAQHLQMREALFREERRKSNGHEMQVKHIDAEILTNQAQVRSRRLVLSG